MFRQYFSYLMLLSFLLFSCGNDENESYNNNTDDTNNNNGNSISVETGLLERTLAHDGMTRSYIVYVPTSYDGNEALPILFNFHGFGDSDSSYMQYADMRALADSENFVLVYPQGSLLSGSSHWNAALPGGDNKSAADDLGFFEAMLESISDTYQIDANRVYACGYSNGGMLAYALACYKSNLIAAFGSVSGVVLDTSRTCEPSHATPLINIHGTNDGVLPYNGSTDYSSVADALNYWKGVNSTTTSSSASFNDNGTIIEQYLYTGGDNGSSVVHYKVIGGGHVWFDINYNGASTGRLVWDFVSQYNLADLQ
ncbi:MAG: alpha/beta hydrolase family esterase [Flavicella sp.]